MESDASCSDHLSETESPKTEETQSTRSNSSNSSNSSTSSSNSSDSSDSESNSTDEVRDARNLARPRSFHAPIPPWTFPNDMGKLNLVSDIELGTLSGMGVENDRQMMELDQYHRSKVVFRVNHNKNQWLPPSPGGVDADIWQKLKLNAPWKQINASTHEPWSNPILARRQVQQQVENVQQALEDGFDGGMIDSDLLETLFIQDDEFQRHVNDYDPTLGTLTSFYSSPVGKFVVRIGSIDSNQVYLHPIQQNNILFSSHPRFTTRLPIYDVSSSLAPTHVLALRHASSISFIVPRFLTADEVYDSDSEEDDIPVFVDLLGIQTFDSGLLAARWNPTITNEMISLGQDGKLTLSVMEGLSKKRKSKNMTQIPRMSVGVTPWASSKLDVPLWDTWGDVVFTHHPRLIVTANHELVNLVDLRKITKEKFSWSKELYKGKKLSALAYREPYVVTASDSKVVLLDYRMPGRELLTWLHSFGSERRNRVTFLDLIGGNGKGEVVIGTRRHDYLQVFPFTPSTEFSPPIALASTYSIPTAIVGAQRDPVIVKSNLSSHGIQLVSENDLAENFTLLQLTSDGALHVNHVTRQGCDVEGVLTSDYTRRDIEVLPDSHPLDALAHDIFTRKDGVDLPVANVPDLNHAVTLYDLATNSPLEYSDNGIKSLGGKQTLGLLQSNFLEDVERMTDPGGTHSLDIISTKMEIDPQSLDRATTLLEREWKKDFSNDTVVRDLVAASIVLIPRFDDKEAQITKEKVKLNNSTSLLQDLWDNPTKDPSYPPLRRYKPTKRVKREALQQKEKLPSEEPDDFIESYLEQSQASVVVHSHRQSQQPTPSQPRFGSQLMSSQPGSSQTPASQASQKRKRRSGF